MSRTGGTGTVTSQSVREGGRFYVLIVLSVLTSYNFLTDDRSDLRTIPAGVEEQNWQDVSQSATLSIVSNM